MQLNKYVDMPSISNFSAMAKSTNAKGAGRKPSEIKKSRTALFIEEGLVKSVKYIMYSDEKTQTDIVNEALTEYLKQWEKKNGPIPKK